MKTPVEKIYENFNKMSDAEFKAWMLNNDLEKIEDELLVISYFQGFIDCKYGEFSSFFDETIMHRYDKIRKKGYGNR